MNRPNYGNAPRKAKVRGGHNQPREAKIWGTHRRWHVREGRPCNCPPEVFKWREQFERKQLAQLG